MGWQLILEELSHESNYIKSSSNIVIDSLSRLDKIDNVNQNNNNNIDSYFIFTIFM